MVRFTARPLSLLLLSTISCVEAPTSPGEPDPEIDDPSFIGWQIEHGPELTNENLLHSWSAGEGGAFAIGMTSLLQFDGTRWTRVAGVPGGPTAIGGADENHVYVGNGDSEVYRWDGTSLTLLPPTGAQEGSVRSIWAASPTEVYAVIALDRKIVRFDGERWESIGWPESHASNGMIRGFGSNDLLAVMNDEAFRWDGDGWRKTDLYYPSNLRIAVIGADEAVAVGSRGILRYDGTTWAKMDAPETGFLWGVWSSAPDRIFAVGDHGTILRYDGRRWEQMQSGTSRSLRSVTGTGDSVFATGDSGLILSLVDGRWEIVHQAPELSSVWAASSSVAFAAGADGTILRRVGRSWRYETTGTEATFRDIWGASAQLVFAVGDGGTILRYDGTRWAPMASGSTEDLQAIWGRSASEVYAVGDAGTLLKFDGIAWQPLPSGVSIPLNAIAEGPSGEVVIGGRGGLLVLGDEGVRPLQAPNAEYSTYLSLVRRGDELLASGIIQLPGWKGSTGFFSALEDGEWRPLGTQHYPTSLSTADGATTFGVYYQEVVRIEGETTVTLSAPPHPRVSWSRLSEVWAVSPTELFVVGSGSTILHARL